MTRGVARPSDVSREVPDSGQPPALTEMRRVEPSLQGVTSRVLPGESCCSARLVIGSAGSRRPPAYSASGLAGADAASVFAQWLAIEEAMSRRRDVRAAAAWLDDGADVSVLNGATGGYLGSTTRFGNDAISLAGGGFLQTFTGLTEGMRRIA